MENVCAVIYTSANSCNSKKCPSLGEVLFRPVISWVNDALNSAGIEERCYICGEGEDISAFTGNAPVFKRKAESGHPVFSAKEWVSEHSEKDIVLLSSEAPFIDGKSIENALLHDRENNYDMTVLASGGRASFIKELSKSALWIKGGFLLELFDLLAENDPTGANFVPGALKVLSERAKVSGTYVANKPELNMTAGDPEENISLNAAARTVIFKKHCANGVEFLCTDGIIIEPQVKIGEGTKILPGTILKGNTVIGENCVIGPNSYIEDSIIGNETEVNSTQVRSSELKNNVKIGPFSQVRPNCVIHDGCKIGDYVEIKNSVVGARTAVAHLTYIGDADVGEGVNFGCGCCIANYDGQHKHRTTIGNHAFLGCNTNLVAPITLKDFAYTAAGSTITKDVPEYALGVARTRQQIIPDWVKKKNAIKIK